VKIRGEKILMGSGPGLMNHYTLKEKISSLCKKHPKVIAAYLFGSYAKESAGEGSDVDIALILEDHKPNNFEYLNFKVSIERVMNKNVDLTILNHAGEILKHQVRKYGIIIYEKNPEMRKQWEVYSRKLYQDFLHLHHIYMKKLHEHFGAENG